MGVENFEINYFFISKRILLLNEYKGTLTYLVVLVNFSKKKLLLVNDSMHPLNFATASKAR